MTQLAQPRSQAPGHPADTGAPVTLADVLAAARSDCDAGQVSRAYAAAAAWHEGQMRRSGDPYITHPLAVALILAELGMGTAALCAALLHDVIQDTPCTLALLRSQFGDEVADLVDQVAQLDGPGLAAPRAAGGHEDLVIKLADRLHNMRTISYMPPAKQQRKSREVLDHFAPTASALGLEQIGAELAGLAAAALTIPGGLASAAGIKGGRDPGLSRRLLASAGILLPAHARDRWLEEWIGEISSIPTRRGRARFTAQMLAGMPHFAVALWRPIRAANS